MTNVTAGTANPGPLSRKVIEFIDTTARLVKRAKQPDFSPDEWNVLAALVAVDAFERVSANKGSRNWQEDMALRSQWSANADFDSKIRRIKELGNLVYMDIEENIRAPGQTTSVNTLGIFEFNEAGKLRKVTAYQQLDP